ncbi:hypothetical protein GKZ89_19490 [Bacillus mangrovi]|uniref:Uncharacterized protein n=1 Tax=Metabacillus mangrovi TaxID=1491830 RepID=A0A7X2SAZ6_9BACI|nr:hypothetical protein [Metabacillus mangrovi]MTH55581.1 hypothetical protein [Metabacillus mangrovi]
MSKESTKHQKDHPEQVPTDKESLHDKFESEQNVDSIPLDDLKKDMQDEKKKDKTKDNSSSEDRFKKQD